MQHSCMNETLYRWTFKFHKVVRQQNSSAVEDYILSYSAVYLRIQKWKNYWNRSTFAKVIVKIKVAPFLRPTVYISVTVIHNACFWSNISLRILASCIEFIIVLAHFCYISVARLAKDTPVHQQALMCRMDLSLGRPPDRSWRRPQAVPEIGCSTKFIGTTPPADLWKRATWTLRVTLKLRSLSTTQ